MGCIIDIAWVVFLVVLVLDFKKKKRIPPCPPVRYSYYLHFISTLRYELSNKNLLPSSMQQFKEFDMDARRSLNSCSQFVLVMTQAMQLSNQLRSTVLSLTFHVSVSVLELYLFAICTLVFPWFWRSCYL